MTDRKLPFFERFTAQPLRRQMIALVIGAQLLAHASTIAIVSNTLTSGGRIDKIWVELSDAFITTISALDSGADQDAVLDAVRARDARFDVASGGLAPPPINERVTEAIAAELPLAWRDRVSVHELNEDTNRPFGGPDGDPFVILAQLPDGEILQFVPNSGVVSRNAPIVAATLTVMFLAVPLAVLAVWSGALILRPVERLSRAAQQFSVDAQTELLTETGAEEVRSAIRSFNTMQERLRAMMDDRAQTLASIGHDLRTPLTRLSLRLEAVDLGDSKDGVDRDIAEMRQMIDGALDFLRNESKPVDMILVDLGSLCETVVSEFADQGGKVMFAGQVSLTAMCDLNLTRRALSNIIENALKYAGSAYVSLDGADDRNVTIKVVDYGLGIPDPLIPLASKPFNRLETSLEGQEGSPGGFGLGLAIAEDCMTRQGGGLTLENNKPNGLIATLKLPAHR